MSEEPTNAHLEFLIVNAKIEVLRLGVTIVSFRGNKK